MKITLLQSNFARALSQVSRVVGTRTTLPVLSNVLIEAKKGKISLSATDLEVGISTQTIGKVDEEGSITLPARILSDFISNNKDESIGITTTGNSANLKSSHFEATINGISAEEFPSIPKPPEDSLLEIKRDVLLDALKKVGIAPATDETRPVLAGVFFQFQKDRLILAATDSYRLAEKKIDSVSSRKEDQTMIIPARTITEIIRLLANDNSEKLVISSTDNQVAFQLGETYVVSRLIEGAFPNYSQIIPATTKTTAKMKLSEFLSAVKMTSLFAKDSANNNIRLETGDKLTVSSIGSQAGSATSTIEATTEGGKISVAFNAKYVLDVLNVLGGEEITIRLVDSFSAAIFESGKKDNYIYIVMPLKLEN